jgi:hypothetical protein
VGQVEGRSHKKQPEKKAGHNKQFDEEDVVDAAELGLSSAAGPDEADRSFATEMMESAAEEKVAAGGKKTGLMRQENGHPPFQMCCPLPNPTGDAFMLYRGGCRDKR